MSPTTADTQGCEFCNASTYFIFPCQLSGMPVETVWESAAKRNSVKFSVDGRLGKLLNDCHPSGAL